MATTSDSESDYGWDLSIEDEEHLAALVERVPAPSAASTSLLTTARRSNSKSTGSNPEAAIKAGSAFAPALGGPSDDIAASLYQEPGQRDFADIDPGFSYSHEAKYVARNESGMASMVTKDTSTLDAVFAESVSKSLSRRQAEEDDVSYPDLSSAVSNLAPEPKTNAESESESAPKLESDPESLPIIPSPLTRFRTYPRKPLTVTELASGAWCELQYEYILTRLPGGKKTRSAAMEAGSRVHQALEDEVHVTVKVDVIKKEDAFALKAWNVIQGLRTLREKGLTRELEVWGIVHGQVVNGLIDGLTHKHPDAEFAEEHRNSQSSGDPISQESKQPKITQSFPKEKTHPATPPDVKVYIVDVKTRGTKTLPSGAAVRPTKIQLFLYHRFLSEMAAGKLDFFRVIRRYGLDPDETFSDAFLAQIGNLHNEVFYDAESAYPPSPTHSMDSISTHSAPEQLPDLIRYPTLRSLIRLLSNELRLTFPKGADSIGDFVCVEYRLRPRYAEDGTVVGSTVGYTAGQNTIPVQIETLDLFLNRYMQWWNGERRAQGVDVEEASFKCTRCEFSGICEWRKEQDEERVRLVKKRLAAKKRDAESSAGKSGRAKDSGVAW